MSMMSGLLGLLTMFCLAIFGGLVSVLIRGWPTTRCAWLARLTHGWVLAAVLLPALLPWLWRSAPSQSVMVLWVMSGVSAAVLFGLWRRQQKKRSPFNVATPHHDCQPWRWWHAALAMYLFIAFVLLAMQAMQTPTLPWDAWGTWMSRAEAQFGAPMFIPEVDFTTWAAAEQGTHRWAHAAYYPGAIPRLAVLIASASQGWHDSVVHLLWPCWWLVMGGVMWLGLRRLGVSKNAAWLTTAILLGLPMMQAHAALAGYADMPLACAVLMSFFALLEWQKKRGWRTGVWFVLTLLVLPCLKMEGAIWMLLLLSTSVIGLFSGRWRWVVLVLGLLLVFGAMPLGGLPVPLPGLGVFKLQWGQVNLGVMGTMSLHLRPVWREVAATLWLHPNWMFLWWVWPVLFAWRWRALKQTPLGLIGWFATFSWGFLFVLFFLSDASLWAKNLTSINRIVLQVAPVFLAMLALMWTQPLRHTIR